ncbi:MAG: PqqD family protein [Oligoflexia bacterium]|nr:PqqD family protein [Oligoflexia bacterium]
MRDTSFIPKWKSTVLREQPEPGRLYLYAPAQGSVFEVDGLSVELCQQIDGTRTLEYIVTEMIAKHGPPEARFRADVENFVTELQSRSLLE